MTQLNSDFSGRYLCFILGKEKFAIPLLEVKEVIGNIEITPVPQTPAYYKGVMNLRGQIIPIVDLRIKLNTKTIDIELQRTVIILDYNPNPVGVIVDSIESVNFYGTQDIGPLTVVGSAVENKLLLGVAKNANGMTLILNLEAVLDSNKYLKLAEEVLVAA